MLCFYSPNNYLPKLQLTPIERYALHYLEYMHISDDETAVRVTKTFVYMYRFGYLSVMDFATSLIPNCPIESPFHICLDQEQLESSKRGWELKHLQKLKEEDKELQLMEEDELFTYTREDAYNMVRGLFHSQYGLVANPVLLRCYLVLHLFSPAFTGVRVRS